MTILVDSREKHPWAFPENVRVVPRSTIRQGDYALEGDGTFSIERKSLKDFRNTVAGKAAAWERFVRELRRMDEIGCPQKVVIVEGNVEDYLFKEVRNEAGIVVNVREPECDADPVFLLSRVAELAVIYRTAVLFAADEAVAAALAYHVFCKRMVQLGGKIK